MGSRMRRRLLESFICDYSPERKRQGRIDHGTFSLVFLCKIIINQFRKIHKKSYKVPMS